MAPKIPFPPPPAWFIYDGPSLANFVFYLKSQQNAPDHTLTITSQTSISRSFAFIQGTWQGDGPKAKQFTGTISDGTIRLTCSWGNMKGGTNTLMGTLFPAYNNNVAIPRWLLVGNVVTTDSTGNTTTGGPGMVTGEGVPPPPTGVVA